jgi:succinate dehydrogenase/fumarate reductase cytochrome b subunit (b558 family)
MNAEATSVPLVSPRHRGFLLRRLHSLSGIFPVGIFLLEHLWTNAQALGGQEAFDRAVRSISGLALLPLLEIFGIFLPLAFHALYGIKLAFEGRPNVTAYPLARNWFYVMQRVTGLIALVFIALHLWEFRIAKLLGDMSPRDFYPELSARLSSTSGGGGGGGGVPLLAIGYLVGIAASVVHFANGVWTFSFSWGIFVSRRSQRAFGVACAVFGALVFILGANTAIYFATGAQLAGLWNANSSATERCSVVNPPAMREVPPEGAPSPSSSPRTR